MISLRKLTPNDVPAIAGLVRAAGFPVRSEAGWQWALFQNPEQADVPAGWGAFRDGQLAAMIGLQARTFNVDGKALKVAGGHTFIASGAGRGAGLSLARKALQTDGLAAVYSLNNNALAGRLHKKIGLDAWLGSAGRQRMEWPVHSATMAAGHVLSRLARSDWWYSVLSQSERFGSGARTLPERRPHTPDLVRLDPACADDAKLIDEFGDAIRRSHRAAPERTAAIYAYQLADPDAPGRIALFGYVRGGQLEGIMQLAVTKPNAFEPAEIDIIDLETRPGCDAMRIVPPLIREARTLARHARLSRLRLPFSDRFEPVCFHGTGARFSRTHAHDPAHAAFSDGMDRLRHNWTPTGFEGDFYFALRIAPKRPASRPGNRLLQKDIGHGALQGSSSEA